MRHQLWDKAELGIEVGRGVVTPTGIRVSPVQGDTEEAHRLMDAARGRRAARQLRRIRQEADGIQVQAGVGRVS